MFWGVHSFIYSIIQGIKLEFSDYSFCFQKTTILIVREETHCLHMGYSFRLTARVLLYAPSHRQDNTYHGIVSPVVEHWLEREIAQWFHSMKDRSDNLLHHERMLLPQSYILLPPVCASVISDHLFPE